MGFYDLHDRINWEQACRVLGVSKSALYRYVREGKLPAYGLGERNRWFLRSDCEALLKEKGRSRKRGKGGS